MAENVVQPPRFTSTPLAGRKTSNVLNNLIEVSPIFSTPEKVKKAKSLIPVPTANEIRPRTNCVRSGPAVRKKVLVSTNEAPKKNASEVLPPAPKAKSNSNTGGQAVSSERPVEPKFSKVFPDEKPQRSTAEEPAKSQEATKISNPGVVATKEPRNSIDDVIESVVRSLPRKETGSSIGDFDLQDVSQTKSSRVSKISQRPSTLPIVPEEISAAGTSQVIEDTIFKRTGTQSGWLIPKETKTRVSLKRKNSVPISVTKRSKKIETNTQEEDESLFDSPQVPNLVELSSLYNKRQTYVLKKKPEIADIQEVRHESVTDGIVPLEILSPKSPLVDVNKESAKKENKRSMKKSLAEISSKENEETCVQTAQKDFSEAKGRVKDNIYQDVPPSVKVKESKGKLAKEQEDQLKKCIDVGCISNKSEPKVKSVSKGAKSIKSNKALGQSEKENKEPTVNVEKGEGGEKLKSQYKKKETSLKQDLSSEALKKNTGIRMTLRERKPNVLSADTSVISGNIKKETSSKNKSKPLKPSQEQKENLNEPLVDNTSQKKKTKGNKKTTNVQSVAIELMPSQCRQEPENDIKSVGGSKCQKLEISMERLGANVVSKSPDNVKNLNGNNKKEIRKKKTKEESKTNPEVLVQEDQIRHATLSKDHPNTFRKDKDSPDLPKAKSAERKNQTQNPNSLANIDATTSNKSDVVSLNACALNHNEQLKSTSHEASSLKGTSNNKTEKEISSENKIKRKTNHKASRTNHLDENFPLTPTEKTAVSCSNLPATGKTNTTVSEENKRSQRKTTLGKSSKSQSKRKTAAGDGFENKMYETSDKSPEGENSSVTESKRKYEDMEGVTSSSGSAVKKHKHNDENPRSKSAERPFTIDELFGLDKVVTQEARPGVVTVRSLHINNFLMMGEVRLEPGAALREISTHTSFTVQEGTACVTIKKHTRYVSAGGNPRVFFIPRYSDAVIVNAGNLPLRMEFVKFKG